MTPLTDFLLARITEDEDRLVHEYDCDRFNTYGYGTRLGDCDCAAQRHLLAECEAKRWIVRDATSQLAGRHIEGAQSDGDDGPWMADHVLRLLALPYADHPDYREAWKP